MQHREAFIKCTPLIGSTKLLADSAGIELPRASLHVLGAYNRLDLVFKDDVDLQTQ